TKFLNSWLQSSPDSCKEFVNANGLTLLLDILKSPNLPPETFPFSSSYNCICNLFNTVQVNSIFGSYSYVNHKTVYIAVHNEGVYYCANMCQIFEQFELSRGNYGQCELLQRQHFSTRFDHC